MTMLLDVKPGSEIVGSDDVHVGTLDHVDGERLKLTKADSDDGQHHYIDGDLIASLDGDKVRLSVIAIAALGMESGGERQDGGPAEQVGVHGESARLDEGLEETFPASDPVSAKHIS